MPPPPPMWTCCVVALPGEEMRSPFATATDSLALDRSLTPTCLAMEMSMKLCDDPECRRATATASPTET
jgi:hypothetical protein